MGLNVTLQSYNGSMDFGLIACRKAMPDLPELAKYMVQAHQELLRLTPKTEASDVVAKDVVARPATKPAVKPTVRPTVKPAVKSVVRRKAAPRRQAKA